LTVSPKADCEEEPVLFDLALTRRVLRMVRSREYITAAGCARLKISEKAFGYGRRFPIAAKSEA